MAKDSASVDRLNDLFGDENNLKKKKTSGRPYKRKQRNSGEQGVPKKRAASLDNSFMFTSTPMCTIIEEDGLQENDAQTEVIEKKYLIQESIKLDDLLGMQESTVKQPASDKVIVPLAATKRAPRKSKTMTKVPKKPKSTKGKVNSSKLKPRLSSKSKIISNGTPSLVPSLPLFLLPYRPPRQKVYLSLFLNKFSRINYHKLQATYFRILN